MLVEYPENGTRYVHTQSNEHDMHCFCTCMWQSASFMKAGLYVPLGNTGLLVSSLPCIVSLWLLS